LHPEGLVVRPASLRVQLLEALLKAGATSGLRGVLPELTSLLGDGSSRPLSFFLRGRQHSHHASPAPPLLQHAIMTSRHHYDIAVISRALCVCMVLTTFILLRQQMCVGGWVGGGGDCSEQVASTEMM
jgi:hypothetical protein